MATNAIHLTVKCNTTGTTLLEVTVEGHESVYRDKAFKAFCAICFDFDMSFRHAQRADLYELIYRGWLERNGRDIRHFELGTYTICIEH